MTRKFSTLMAMFLSLGFLYFLWDLSGNPSVPTVHQKLWLSYQMSRTIDTDEKRHANYSDLSWSKAKPNESETYISEGIMQEDLRSTTAEIPSKPGENVRNLKENLYVLAPEIFDTVPQTFLSSFKTPCWYWDEVTLSCLPYFYLLGMPKCGTTDIWSKMTGHYQILPTYKEAQFWTRARLSTNPSRGDIYNKLKTYTQREKKLLLPDGTNADLIYGDGSPSTYWDNRSWRNYTKDEVFDGPDYIIADILQTLQPDVKLIVVFREPVDRLYSDYLYTKKSPAPAPIEFQELVSKSLGEFNSCVNRTNSERECIYDVHPYLPTRYFLGLYWIYTIDWLRIFPRDQIKFIELADWKSNCQKLLPEIFEFLEVNPLQPSQIQSICRKSPQNVNPKKKKHGIMLPQTRKQLQEFYRPYNQKLFELLQDNKFDYNQRYI